MDARTGRGECYVTRTVAGRMVPAQSSQSCTRASGMRGREEIGDDGDAVGAGRHHAARALGRDAADGDQRQSADALLPFGDALEALRAHFMP